MKTEITREDVGAQQFHRLWRLNIRHLEDLQEMSLPELLSMRGIGVKTARRLLEASKRTGVPIFVENMSADEPTQILSYRKAGKTLLDGWGREWPNNAPDAMKEYLGKAPHRELTTCVLVAILDELRKIRIMLDKTTPNAR